MVSPLFRIHLPGVGDRLECFTHEILLDPETLVPVLDGGPCRAPCLGRGSTAHHS